jgi:tRNA U34 5-carboxymethylaminomethyl modifying enzyme MnmG/GidA
MTLKDKIYNIIRKRCISDMAAEHAAEEVEMLVEQQYIKKRSLGTVMVIGVGVKTTMIEHLIEAVESKTGEKIEMVNIHSKYAEFFNQQLTEVKESAILKPISIPDLNCAEKPKASGHERPYKFHK